MKYLLLLLLSVAFTSCGKREDVKVEGVEMGMAYKVLIREKVSNDTLEKVKSITAKTFDEIDKKLNHWNKESEISLWNASKSVAPQKVSPFLLDTIKIADQVFSLSGGAYDPSLGRAIHLWKISLRMGKVLSPQEISICKECTGWDKVVIGDTTLQKTHPDLRIDLDGITKGYFCDILSKRLKDIGLKHFLIEWAGEVKATGGPFKVLAQETLIPLQDSAIATSGHLFQIYQVDNDLYSHFVDPVSLQCIKVQDISILKSITNESAAIADGLATASILE